VVTVTLEVMTVFDMTRSLKERSCVGMAVQDKLDVAAGNFATAVLSPPATHTIEAARVKSDAWYPRWESARGGTRPFGIDKNTR
jgi:hypothetical protein